MVSLGIRYQDTEFYWVILEVAHKQIKNFWHCSNWVYFWWILPIHWSSLNRRACLHCKLIERFSRAGPRGRGREWATLRVHPLSWLLSNNRLEEVCSTLTKGTFSSRLLLSNQDKGCTPTVAHSLPLPLGPALLNLWNIGKRRRCMCLHKWYYRGWAVGLSWIFQQHTPWTVVRNISKRKRRG